MTEQLKVEVHGTAETALVFVHGFGGGLQDWDAQVGPLSSAFMCVALDLPGYGDSDVPPQATVSALASAVNEAKRRSGASRFVLIGHGLGCKVLREAYWQASEDVIGAVLIDGSFCEGHAGTLVGHTRQAIDRSGFVAYAEQRVQAMFVEGSDPALKIRALERVRRMDPEFGRAMYLEAAAWDPIRGKETLCALKAPVLLLQSTHLDSQFRRSPMRRARTRYMDTVMKLCQRSATKSIPDCGHFLMIEAAATVNREIVDFVTGLSSTRAPAWRRWPAQVD